MPGSHWPLPFFSCFHQHPFRHSSAHASDVPPSHFRSLPCQSQTHATPPISPTRDQRNGNSGTSAMSSAALPGRVRSRRLKIAIACERCRFSKKKCDGAQPGKYLMLVSLRSKEVVLLMYLYRDLIETQADKRGDAPRQHANSARRNVALALTGAAPPPARPSGLTVPPPR